MSAWWFFMSYARADDRDAREVQRFFKDLKQAVGSKVQLTPGTEPGYLDQDELRPGDHWPDDLAKAVCGARTFVSIISARYFSREYCGREWSLFERRLKRLPESPPLIIPVLWDKPEQEGLIPPFASDLQFVVDTQDVSDKVKLRIQEYGTWGLRSVMRRSPRAYQEIVEKLARRIIQVAQKYELPPLPSQQLPELREVDPKFPPGIATQRLPPHDVFSPFRPCFLFLTGTREEMSPERQDAAETYGVGLDRVDWRPFAPSSSEQIGLVAQTVAQQRGQIPIYLKVTGRPLDDLRESEKQQASTIIVIDPWAVRVGPYLELLKEFDRLQFGNCVIIVAWSMNDPRNGLRAALEKSLRESLWRWFQKSSTYVRTEVCDSRALQDEIATALEHLDALLAPRRGPARSVAKGEDRYASVPVNRSVAF